MTSATIARARRNLREQRASDLVGTASSPVAEARYRDSLLTWITQQAALRTATDTLRPESLVDAAMSIALATVAESDMDTLMALSVSSEVLAEHRQFARLSLLAPKYRDVSQRIADQRPFLAAALRSYSDVLQGFEHRATHELAMVLGLGSDVTSKLPRIWPHMTDALIANGLRVWLENQTIDELEYARSIALRFNDDVLFSTCSMILAYIAAASESDATRVVMDSVLASGITDLSRYLSLHKVRTLFPAQKEAIEQGALDDNSFVASMPTSAGKTFLAELRIAATLSRDMTKRAIYLAPYRLLAHQVQVDLREGLRRLGIVVRDLGSAYDLSIEDELLSGELPHVAIMTPERMDALMRLANTERKGSDTAKELIESVALVVVDEIQLLYRPSRGPKFEMVLTRLQQQLPNVPVFGLAASSADVTEIATWVGASAPRLNAVRPTGTMELLWKTDGALVQRFENSKSTIAEIRRAATAIDSAADLIARIREDRFPILVVEPKRDLAEEIVRRVNSRHPRTSERWRAQLSMEQRSRLDNVAEQVRATMGEQSRLAVLLRDGLAFHHAGVPSHLLREIESLVRERLIRVLGATTTVAEGAHLPFHVVVIPHLNFQGPSKRLDAHLYMNIVGRAGRASVAPEGVVIVLDSDSRSLRGYVENTLWSSNSSDTPEPLLLEAFNQPDSLDAYRTAREVRGQLLAWLGDPGSYTEMQSSRLAALTLAGNLSRGAFRPELVERIEECFHDFESDGLSRAASPYRLTSIGQRVRLAGLSAQSCLRMERMLSQFSETASFDMFSDLSILTPSICDFIATLVYETEEVIEHSLWFRQLKLKQYAQVEKLRELSNSGSSWPREHYLYQIDIGILSGWIQGIDYETLSHIAPIFDSRGLFGKSDTPARVSDTAEYLGRISHPASWAWNAVVAMLGSSGDNVPGWIRSALEYGVPSESAVEFVHRYGMPRRAATLLSENLSPQLSVAVPLLWELDESDFAAMGLTAADRQRISSFSSSV